MRDRPASENTGEKNESCDCPEGSCGGGVDRRRFIRIAGTGAAALSAFDPMMAIAGPFDPQDAADHFVPADKKLNPEWVNRLFEKGAREWCKGKDLETIGMPAGGVCAGQMYLTGDGRLVHCDIFNQNVNSGYGQVNYKDGRKPDEMVVNVREYARAPEIDQGFALRVEAGGDTFVRALDADGFPGVRFCGEYPIARIEYREEDFPVETRLEAFSPFIPLNAEDSALPATVLQYTVKNTSSGEARVTLAGWLENAACIHSAREIGPSLIRYNRIVKGGKTTAVLGGARLRERPGEWPRPPEVLADFEGGSYGEWTVEGEAFGRAPAGGTLLDQQQVAGFKGKGLVNTYLGGDGPVGKLISPEFTIGRPFIGFLIGGGNLEGRTCINLKVGGRTVRTAAGENNELLRPHNWNVEEFAGRGARIEIVDAASGGWGHINIDQIEFRDEPMGMELADFRRLADHGTLALAAIHDGAALASAALPGGKLPENLFAGDGLAEGKSHEAAPDLKLRGAVGRSATLAPGEEAAFTFVVSWCMPNMYRGDRWVGNHYAKRFGNAADVAEYVARNLERLAGDTRLWHDTYYDSSLPYWLLFRLHSTVSNLATTTCQWWRSGRFWAYEGCGCCHGTCGHVWNYEHAMARLFPELERSVRDMQDFAEGVGFISETGEIRFRGEGWRIWAGDSQGGYILKAYREHLCSRDDGFLNRNWRHIRRAMEFLIEQDANGDGLIEGRQHQTYDMDYFGANTMVGSLYLGALRAAEEMAREVGDQAFAAACRGIFEAGMNNSVERLFNGEYYIQDVNLSKHAEGQYGDGCLADHMFGQGWAHQVRLGYLYPRDTVLKSLGSIWKYCWAPDVNLQNEKHKPERWFAFPGEAGLFTCTWPKSRHLGPKSTRYRNEIWTGIEYQVANHMAWEGMLTEALAVCRAVHERYHPGKRNPFNEIECGDHYARALASWGVLISLSGFEYHGPRGRIGFAPRLEPEDFRAAFTAAEGWGTFSQQRAGGAQTNRIEVRWGRLRVRELAFELAPGARARSVRVNGAKEGFDFTREEDRLRIRLQREVVIGGGIVPGTIPSLNVTVS